jgi:hypothetical protein
VPSVLTIPKPPATVVAVPVDKVVTVSGVILPVASNPITLPALVSAASFTE